MLEKINEDYWNQMKNKKNNQPEELKEQLERVTKEQVEVRKNPEEVL